MKKKLAVSMIIAGALLLLTVIQVIAGATFDYGTLAGEPPAGQANWVAWWSEYPNGTPYEIMTEDNTNADDGVNNGYSNFFSETTFNWVLQIENFLYDPDPNQPPNFDPDQIYMMFGGLGETHSGTLWKTTISEWALTESSTNHGEIPVLTTDGDACPLLYDPIVVSSDTTHIFYGALGTYHVYRSQNASGAGNGANNGQYFYIDTVTTDAYGIGSFVDNTTEQSWYIVIQADPGTNEIIGCHSEPAGPTDVTIFGFEATYNTSTKAVDLVWQTTDEVDILGYNVLRSTSEAGVKTQVNTALINLDPDHAYDFTDDTVEMGMTYYYWIEYVETDDDRGTVGPEEVQTWFEYFNPLFNL